VLAAGPPTTPVERPTRSKPLQKQVRLQQSQWDQILTEYRVGALSATALAKKYGVNSQTVINRIHAAGIPIKQPWSQMRRRAQQATADDR
jgi:hypothetical protein